MRDILKHDSGTPSGTDVSLSKNADFSDFKTRGQRSKTPKNDLIYRKKANCQLIVSLTFYSIQFKIILVICLKNLGKII